MNELYSATRDLRLSDIAHINYLREKYKGLGGMTASVI